MLDWALTYARGGLAVFPCHTVKLGKCTCGAYPCGENNKDAGKHPRINAWQKNASSDETQVKQWWTHWPDANIGAIPASIGAFVPDIDPRNGGDAALAAWELANGKLPETLVALTGGGGWHYWYKLPAGVTELPGKWLQGIDIKHKGYVIMPPSHHVALRDYQWQDFSVKPVEAPRDLIDAIVSAGKQGANVLSRSDYLNALAGVPEGGGDTKFAGRDDACIRVAGYMRTKFLAIGMTDEEAKPIVQAALAQSAAMCTPPYPQDRVRDMVNRVFKMDRSTLIPASALTDKGNAQLLVDKYGDVIRWADDAGEWYHCGDDNLWRRKAGTHLVLLAGTLGKVWVIQSLEVRDDAFRKKVNGWGLTSMSAPRIKAAVDLAKSELEVRGSAVEFDADPHLVGLPGGKVLDLAAGRERELLKSDLVTNRMACGFSDEEPRRWLDFLDWMTQGSPEIMEFLRRWAGYCLSGEVGKRKMLYLHGVGSNGKSTYNEVLAGIWGDYAMTADNNLLVATRDKKEYAFANLIGKRLVIASEVPAGARLDESTFKQLTGGDTVRGRHPAGRSFEFTPTFKINLAANHLLTIKDSTDSTWDRPILVPCKARIEDERKNSNLVSELIREEGPAILGWALGGWNAFIVSGRDLAVPASSKEATKRYQQAEDQIGPFIEAQLVLGGEASFTSLKLIWERYNLWCASEGLGMREMLGRQGFLSALETRLDLVRARHGGEWGYKNVAVAANAPTFSL